MRFTRGTGSGQVVMAWFSGYMSNLMNNFREVWGGHQSDTRPTLFWCPQGIFRPILKTRGCLNGHRLDVRRLPDKKRSELVQHRVSLWIWEIITWKISTQLLSLLKELHEKKRPEYDLYSFKAMWIALKTVGSCSLRVLSNRYNHCFGDSGRGGGAKTDPSPEEGDECIPTWLGNPSKWLVTRYNSRGRRLRAYVQQI